MRLRGRAVLTGDGVLRRHPLGTQNATIFQSSLAKNMITGGHPHEISMNHESVASTSSSDLIHQDQLLISALLFELNPQTHIERAAMGILLL